MKVVLVGPYSLPAGGVQVHLVQLVRYLEKRGHTCYVINMGKNKKLRSKQIVSPTSAPELAFYLTKKRDHVCHLHFGGTLHPRLLLLALFSSLVFYKRCAITIHSGGLPTWGFPANPLRRIALRICFGLCEAIICVNAEIAGLFRRLGLKPTRIWVISPFSFENDISTDPLPVDIDFFIRDKDPLICNIGCLEEEYDLELLLRAFSMFTKRRPTAGLIMIGSGSLYPSLMSLISQMNLENRVMLTGDLSHSLTLKILASSDIFVRSACYDGDCISLKEAIHLGVPAIASDTGMRPKEAKLFPIGNEEKLLICLLETEFSRYKLQRSSFQRDSCALVEVEMLLMNLTYTGRR